MHFDPQRLAPGGKHRPPGVLLALFSSRPFSLPPPSCFRCSPLILAHSLDPTGYIACLFKRPGLGLARCPPPFSAGICFRSSFFSQLSFLLLERGFVSPTSAAGRDVCSPRTVPLLPVSCRVLSPPVLLPPKIFLRPRILWVPPGRVTPADLPLSFLGHTQFVRRL